MKKAIQSLYLRVDSPSKSLAKIALAQLILKVLFFYNKAISQEEIRKELKSILGTKVSKDRVDKAIDILIDEKKVLLKEGGYDIVSTKKLVIESALNQFTERQSRVITKFFKGTKTDTKFVSQWFENVTIEFFKEYSLEWIADLCLTNDAVKNKHHGIKAIIDRVTQSSTEIKNDDKEWLKTQYIKFIQSNDVDVPTLLWEYGTSGFSASLIIANTSADPLTVETFKNSDCILDTNVLMYLDLEQSQFAESFKSIEKIFINLGIKPVYFHITRDEFQRSIIHKKNAVIKVFENYNKKVIDELNDPFVNTAIHRQCNKVEDLPAFFDELLDIPEVFSESLKITPVEDVDLDEAVKKGQEDDALKDRINQIYFNRRKKDKKKNPLIHDAGLLAGAEYMRTKGKCFILSRDSIMNQLTHEKPVGQQMPMSIGLDTLINVLAIDNGGTDVDPTNYAPLFANIIKLALIPENDVFKVEDLSKMLDWQTQIADLPDERIIDIAKEFHHKHITGVPEEELALDFSRNFQSAKLELQQDLQKSQKEIHFEKKEKEKYIDRSDKAIQKLKEQYIGELRDKYDGELRRNRILIFGVLPLASMIITAIIIFYKQNTIFSLDQVIGVGTNIIAWMLTDFLFLHEKIVGKYSERVNGINDEVERRIKETVED